jgi:hypothetical protein
VPRPPFSLGRSWHKRASSARRYIKRRVWYDPDTKYEYEADPNPEKHTWHEIDPRHARYREIDPATGQPVNGGEGNWRHLQ